VCRPGARQQQRAHTVDHVWGAKHNFGSRTAFGQKHLHESMGHVKEWNTRFDLNEASVLHMPLPHLLAVCAVHERNLKQDVRLEFEVMMAVSLRRRLMAGSRAQFEKGSPLRI
jgi:hypothetical protein